MKKTIKGIITGLFTVSVALIVAATFSIVACSQSERCAENTARMYYDGTYANGVAGTHFLAGIIVAIYEDNQ